MKLKHILISFAAAGLILLGGCSFLEEKSWDEVIPKTTNDFAELLVGSAYPDPTLNADMIAATSLMDDDVTVIGYNAENDLRRVAEDGPKYTWQATVGRNTSISNTLYYRYYDRILGSNAVLDNIDDAIGLPDDRDRVKAEALALRAYHYWVLVNFYGLPYNHDKSAPGVPLKLISEIDAHVDMPRNTVKEVYDQIVADLTEAVRLMEPLPASKRDSRINFPAVCILFSRVCLHMEDWANCVKYAEMALENGNGIFDMTTLGQTSSNTTNFYLDYRKNPEIEWAFGAEPTSLVDLLRIYGLTMEMAAERFPATWVDDSGETPVTYIADTRRIHGLSQTIYVYPLGNVPTLTKFTTFTNDNIEPKQSFRGAEALLNMAEALAQLGRLDEALDAYNLLRQNRIIMYEDEDINVKADLIEAIRDERRREFMFEGFRWCDLRRYGMPQITHKYSTEIGQLVTYVLEEEDPMYTLPLEDILILENPALTQNPSASTPERQPEI